MKLLKFKINGHPLFSDGLEMNFMTSQRVTEESSQSLHQLFGRHYKQNIVGVTGINASGKTSVLKALAFVLNIYINETQINHSTYEGFLSSKEMNIEAYFLSGSNTLLKIRSTIITNQNAEYIFQEEILWKKRFASSLSKNKLFEFNEKQIEIIRSQENSPYLSKHMSIMISQLKHPGNIPCFMNLISDTNFNIIRVAGNIPLEIVHFFDSSIEYIHRNMDTPGKDGITLKFKNQDEEVFLTNHTSLDKYLSSGTIKGLNVFAAIENVLCTGGFLIIDEIENHFNQEIIRTIMRLFMNQKTNLLGATLIFSTHYTELLDDFDRNDSIFIAFKGNTLRLQNLSELLKRNDYKKSEVYQSSLCGKTAPSYDSYMRLRKYFEESLSIACQDIRDNKNE